MFFWWQTKEGPGWNMGTTDKAITEKTMMESATVEESRNYVYGIDHSMRWGVGLKREAGNIGSDLGFWSGQKVMTS